MECKSAHERDQSTSIVIAGLFLAEHYENSFIFLQDD